MLKACLIQCLRFRVATHTLKSRGRFHQHDEVARVQFHRAPEICLRFMPAGRSAINGAYGYVDASFVRQKLFGLFKLFQSTIVITKAMISIDTFLPVDLACIRLDLLGFLQCDSGQFATLISMIEALPNTDPDGVRTSDSRHAGISDRA